MNLGNREIDQLTCDIILYLYDDAGDNEASTSELRSALNAERGRTIKYRIREYLLPRDLVEEREQGTDEHGRDLPHLYRLTDRGRQFTETFRDDLEPDKEVSIEARVERLERQFRRFRDDYVDRVVTGDND